MKFYRKYKTMNDNNIPEELGDEEEVYEEEFEIDLDPEDFGHGSSPQSLEGLVSEIAGKIVGDGFISNAVLLFEFITPSGDLKHSMIYEAGGNPSSAFNLVQSVFATYALEALDDEEEEIEDEDDEF